MMSPAFYQQLFINGHFVAKKLKSLYVVFTIEHSIQSNLKISNPKKLCLDCSVIQKKLERLIS